MIVDESDQILIEFRKSCVAVAKMLKNGIKLTDAERLSIENNIALVQLHYALWVQQFVERQSWRTS